MEDEFFSSLHDEEIKKVVYKIIDKSLLLSFIGGALLGIVPFVFSSSWKLVSFVFVGASLIAYFAARYSGLKFLFTEDEEE